MIASYCGYIMMREHFVSVPCKRNEADRKTRLWPTVAGQVPQKCKDSISANFKVLLRLSLRFVIRTYCVGDATNVNGKSCSYGG